MSKPVILVVEDDLALLDALTSTLEMSGFDYIGLMALSKHAKRCWRKSLLIWLSAISICRV